MLWWPTWPMSPVVAKFTSFHNSAWTFLAWSFLPVSPGSNWTLRTHFHTRTPTGYSLTGRCGELSLLPHLPFN